MWSHVGCADGQFIQRQKKACTQPWLLNVLKLKHNLVHQTAAANICSVGEWVQTLLDAVLQQVGTGVQTFLDAACSRLGLGSKPSWMLLCIRQGLGSKPSWMQHCHFLMFSVAHQQGQILRLIYIMWAQLAVGLIDAVCVQLIYTIAKGTNKTAQLMLPTRGSPPKHILLQLNQPPRSVGVGM